MFELLRLITEKFVNVISITALIQAKKDHQVHKIGTEIFLLYAALNQIYVTGLCIVEEIESAYRWTSEQWDIGDRDSKFSTKLNQLLPQQYINLRKFSDSFDRWI